MPRQARIEAPGATHSRPRVWCFVKTEVLTYKILEKGAHLSSPEKYLRGKDGKKREQIKPTGESTFSASP